MLLRSIAVLLLVCGCTPPGEHEEPALDLITAKNLAKHVEFLADDSLAGRKPGEPGYELAAAYVAEQLAAMGVLPAADGDWFQPVPLRRYKVAPESARMVVRRRDDDRELVFRDDFSVLGDAVRDAITVDAAVVYVGTGTHAPEWGYSDYDGIDVAGKLVALFEEVPESIQGDAQAHYRSYRTRAAEAARRGAIGVIILRSKGSETRRAWADTKDSIGTRWSATWIEGGEAAGYFSTLKVKAWLNMAESEYLFGLSSISYEEAHAAMLAGEPLSTELVASVSISARSLHETTVSPNVVGLVRGTTQPDEYVVYSAHLDHVGTLEPEGDEDRIHNGFYDNAMGVALMLETARAIAAAAPRRSVLFVAVTAEESGLIGSDYFAANPVVPRQALVANINLDMPLFLYPLADLVAFGSQHSTMQGVAEQAATDEGFALSPDPMPEENLFIRSDQFSFVRRGIPAVFLVSGYQSLDDSIDGEALFRDHLKNHYHKVSDDLTRPVDWDSAVRFARAHTRIGLIVGNAADRPRWNEGAFYGRQYASGE